MSTALKRRNPPRRGVTLVEMLVVVALVVLMMVILVQIFQSALGAMSASRTTQELDVVLRSIDAMIRTDLNGVTAKMTPPNDPALKQGYFEYGENAPADLQGEDTDDFLAFTTKAPEGQVFTGRQYLSGNLTSGGIVNNTIQPITITSQVAEVVYFLRNGNLYRRVFLVAPDRAKSVATTFNNPIIGYNKVNNPACNFFTSMFGSKLPVSWQGMNDLSARPGGVDASGNQQPPILNDLGDLTNRENRAFRPRFSNDFTGPNGVPDGVPDDNNGDGVPDYYPTLYYNANGGNGLPNPTFFWSPNGLTNEKVEFQGVKRVSINSINAFDVYAFPFIFPGMYSAPEDSTLSPSPPMKPTTIAPPVTTRGRRHGLFPGLDKVRNQYYPNHAPLDPGTEDNLPQPSQYQTWWGFPTWRETMTAFNNPDPFQGYNATTQSGWGDPVVSVNANPILSPPKYMQPLGLSPQAFLGTLSYATINTGFLPPVSQTGLSGQPPFSDGAGSLSFRTYNSALNNHLWEDDLILTNVRSFDVKAYDPNAPLYNVFNSSTNTFLPGPFSSDYQDLGYAGVPLPGFIDGWAPATYPLGPPWQPNLYPGVSGGIPIGFGHEGRMPPTVNDFRLHPRRPISNISDNNTGVNRLVRTFDTWSTAYTNAPDSDILLNGYSNTGLSIYPSFPPPYPSPLRGIQIQIRVTDPRNERTKVLTIRQDFTDKL